MPLPHPHGTASGEIGHNASIDTNDTPGSTGGRFIGWGEEGTSAYANRAHWALSENIDYLYDIELEDRAVASELAWVVPGGGETKKQIPYDVFCGDSSYPADAVKGLALLFAVLDDDYNELQTADGKKVYAYQVFDSTDTSTVYKTGFVSSPWVYFATSASTPYTIPASTTVRLIYAGKTNYEDMPVDALTKFLMRAVGELDAGVLLQDGSRQMTGDLDFDGNKAINVDQVVSQASSQLDILSTDDLTFKDQYLTTAVSLSQTGVASLDSFSGQNNSLVGLLNQQVAQHFSFGANQRIWDGGNLLTNDGVAVTPTIGLPSNDTYAMNGELIVGSTTSLVINYTDEWAYVYMDSNGDLADSDMGGAALDNNGTLIAVYYYNSGTEVFDSVFDMREMAESKGRNLEVTFSSDGRFRADFDNLRTAIGFFEGLQRMFDGGEGFAHTRFILRVLGTNTISGDITYDLSNIKELTIVGDGVDQSHIRVTSPTSTAAHFLDCNNYCTLHLHDIKISWVYSTSDQSAGYGAVKGAADRSTFERVEIAGGTKDWANAFVWDTTAGAPSWIHIKQCDATVNQCMVAGSALASNTNYLNRTTVEQCICRPGNAIVALACWAFKMPGWQNKVIDCFVQSGMQNGVLIGHLGNVENCMIYADTTNGSGVIVEPYTGSSGLISATVRNNVIVQGTNGLFVQNEASYTDPMHVLFEGNTVTAKNGVNIGNDSSADSGCVTEIVNNRFDSCTDYGIYGYYARMLKVSGNSFMNHDGTGVVVDVGTVLMASGNYFEKFGANASSLLPHAFHLEPLATEGSIITGNYISNGGDTLPSNAIMIHCRNRHVIISNNHLDMDLTSPTHDGIRVYSTVGDAGTGILIHGNVFRGGRDAIILEGTEAQVGKISITGNTFAWTTRIGIKALQSGLLTIDSNIFKSLPGCCIDSSNTTDGEMVSVSDNIFERCDGDKNDSGLAVSAVIFMDHTGASNECLSRIIGNTFNDCGNRQAQLNETCAIIYVNRKGVVMGNIFNGFRGSYNSDKLRMVWARGTAVIANNLFYSLNSTVPDGEEPDEIWGIYAEGARTQIHGNIFSFEGSFVTNTLSSWGCIYSNGADTSYVGNSNITNFSAESTLTAFISENGTGGMFFANSGVTGIPSSPGATTKPTNANPYNTSPLTPLSDMNTAPNF